MTTALNCSRHLPRLSIATCHYDKGILRMASFANTGFERTRPGEAAHTRQPLGRYQPGRCQRPHISRRCGSLRRGGRWERVYSNCRLVCFLVFRW